MTFSTPIGIADASDEFISSAPWLYFSYHSPIIFFIDEPPKNNTGSSHMEHLTVHANGARLHVVRTGRGRPLLLLHGWPEFWLTWEKVMGRLADRYTLVAPDLRGFGDSDKPAGPWGPADHTADLVALLDELKIERVGVVGHDVGGAVMQALARKAPGRL